MEHLSGEMLVRKNKDRVNADEALSDKEVIALYFSAHWCPPCRKFTPVLADFYEEVTEASQPLEIIFVSSDRTEEALYEYMNECHGNWLAVPFGSPASSKLQQKYSISGIPALIVIKKDGTLVTSNGRNDVQSKGAQAYADWSK